MTNEEQITIKKLKNRLEKIDENKTIDELYMNNPEELDKLLKGSSFYIKASWDYDD